MLFVKDRPAKTQVSLTRFLQSEVKIIHIIVQNNTCYNNIFKSFPYIYRILYLSFGTNRKQLLKSVPNICVKSM